MNINSKNTFSNIEWEEKEISSFLQSNSIPYLEIHHEATVSMDDYKEIEQKTHSLICKNLFLSNRQGTRYYLLVMKGDKPFKTKELSSQIHSARLSFGNEDKLKEYLHCFKGSTSVFGLLFDKENKVTLLIDEDVLKEETLGFHPCANTTTFVLKTKDLLDRYLPIIHHDYQIVELKGK